MVYKYFKSICNVNNSKAVTGILTPVYLKAEKCRFFHEILGFHDTTMEWWIFISDAVFKSLCIFDIPYQIDKPKNEKQFSLLL